MGPGTGGSLRRLITLLAALWLVALQGNVALPAQKTQPALTRDSSPGSLSGNRRDHQRPGRDHGPEAHSPHRVRHHQPRQPQEISRRALKEAVKPEEIRAEEVTLKKLGLVPQDFDLRKTTDDLLTEQAAAFYDYKKKKLFILDTNATLSERPVLVHELAHALADEHFHLERYILKGKSDDASVARQAVMEGQATWLMTEYMMFKVGTTLRKAGGAADVMNQMNASSGAGSYPVFDSAPPLPPRVAHFPYTKGFAFQQAVILKYGNRGFAEVFRNPLLSAQHIIHPETYFNKVIPTHPALPQVKLKGYKGLVGGGVGELDHEILLRLHTTKEDAVLAEKWRGAQYRILENKTTKASVLTYASDWQDAESARKYFQLYKRVLQHKWKTFRVDNETDSTVDGKGDDGFFPPEAGRNKSNQHRRPAGEVAIVHRAALTPPLLHSPITAYVAPGRVAVSMKVNGFELARVCRPYEMT